MTNDPTLLRAQNLETRHVRLGDLALRAGESAMICTRTKEEGTTLMDVLLGLELPAKGTVELLGRKLIDLDESQRVRLLAEVAHIDTRGGLMSNLKLWENLILPAQYHGRLPVTMDQTEARILEALRVVEKTDDWVRQSLPALPDALSVYDSRLAGLIRAVMQRPRLLACEYLFDDLDRGPTRKLTSLLGWIRRQHPDLAILHLHLGRSEDGHFDLNDLGNPSILNVEPASHGVSQKH